MTSYARLAPFLLAASLLAACGGGGSDTPAPATAPGSSGPVTLSATAGTTQLLPGGTATLTGTASDNSAITWQLAQGSPGALSAATGASVTYTAPASGLSAPTPVTVSATAGGATKTVTLLVHPSPGTPGLSLLAGSLGSHTIVDGTGTAARFGSIGDMAVAADGSLAVVDFKKLLPVVRRIGATGAVTSIPVPAGEDPVFWAVHALGVAADGTAWMVRENGVLGTLLRLGTDGNVSAAGGPQPELLGATGLVAGAAGELFVQTTSYSACALYRVTDQGAVALLAGGGCGAPLDGRGAAAVFSAPSDLTRAADGSLYMVDDEQIRRIAMDGTVTTIVPRDSAGVPVLTFPFRPRSIAARPDGSLALLAWDAKEQVVWSVAPDGLATVLLRRPVVPVVNGTSRRTDFALVRSDAAGRLLLATQGEIHVLQGSTTTLFAGLEDDAVADVDGAGAAARFVDPKYVASDLRGNVYVADQPVYYNQPVGFSNDRGLYVRRIDTSGNVTTVIRNAQFGRPAGLLADQGGNLYVVEQNSLNGRYRMPGGAVYKIGPDGTTTLIAGTLAASGSVDGKGPEARFVWPTFAGIAPDGTLYVNDDGGVLRKVAQDGTVTTVTALPDDVARAPDGKRYGYDGETVYRIEADGSRTVVAGSKGMEGTVLGPLPGALSAPIVTDGMLGPTGLHTFALISNSAIVKLVLPH